MTIAAILDANKEREIVSVGADTLVRDAVALLAEKRIGAMPVLEGDGVVGIVSERDVIYCLKGHGPEALEWPVERAMSSPAITVDPSTPILSALALMTEKRIRHLPVVSGGELIGLVSIGDLVKYRMEQIEQEAEAMRSYIQGA